MGVFLMKTGLHLICSRVNEREYESMFTSQCGIVMILCMYIAVNDYDHLNTKLYS